MEKPSPGAFFSPALKGYPVVGRSATRAAALLLLVASLVAPAVARAAPTVLCLGDSLTEGYGVAPEHAYPSLLEARLRERGHAGIRVINAGTSGATSASAMSKLRWHLRAQPDVLILALGANDGLRGLDLERTRANLEEAIALARRNGVTVILAGMKLPPNYGPDYTRRFERMYPEIAAESGVALIPFLLEGVAARPTLNLPDGIHPNAKGYERVIENVIPVLEPLL